MAFIINTGAVKVPLEDNLGRVFGHAVYVPTDLGILERYQKGLHLIDDMAAEFQKVAEEVTKENVFELMQKPAQKLKEFCDFVFGNGFYENAFSEINPFTMVPGDKFICLIVLESVVNDITERHKSKSEKVAKYLKGYENV